MQILIAVALAAVAAIQTSSSARVTRSGSVLVRAVIDGDTIDASGVTLVNPTVGETGIPRGAATLGPEHGFYVRRNQLAEIRLPVRLGPGPHHVELALGLGGVATTTITADLELA